MGEFFGTVKLLTNGGGDNCLTIQAAAVIAEGNQDPIALLSTPQLQGGTGGFTGCLTFSRRLNAVVDRIAHQVQ